MGGPLFPEAAGEVLHAILHPKSPARAPYTHTFNWPPTEYDEDGNPLPPRIEPTITVIRQIQHEALAQAYETVGRLMLYRPDLHPLLFDHGIDRSLAQRTDVPLPTFPFGGHGKAPAGKVGA